MSSPDPFEMLGPTDESLRRAERAFGLHMRAEAIREKVMPITPGEAHEVTALGPMSFAHPAAFRGVTNGALRALGAICDGVAHRLSPELFEQN